MQIQVVSFGFKHGVPIDADTVFDCRFLPNPHWVDELRPAHRPGRAGAATTCSTRPTTAEFLDRVDDLLALVLPAYVKEGKSYLTIGIGCTGGRHRSVVLAEELARRIAGHGFIALCTTGTSTGDGARTAGKVARPPRVVALGGGHGLAATLRAVRRYAGDITAIVSVADDGGSSGRLRDAFGIPAPGDLRRCLVALGDPDSLWGRAFEYRFEAGELEGHALGNLVIAGLAGATGDFTGALVEAGRLVGAEGGSCRPPPARSCSRPRWAGEEVVGQVRVQDATGPISRVALVPADAAAAGRRARRPSPQADQVILGPGSLYTSVLAVTAVPALREALAGPTGGPGLRLQPAPAGARDGRASTPPPTSGPCGPTASRSTWSFTTRGRCQPVASMCRSSKRPLARPDGLAHDPVLLGCRRSGNWQMPVGSTDRAVIRMTQ